MIYINIIISKLFTIENKYQSFSASIINIKNKNKKQKTKTCPLSLRNLILASSDIGN